MYCIYRITNKVNGKTYIGQHKYKKLNDSYMGSGILIKKAIKKYGIENFKKEILEFNIPTVELVNDWEQMYILFERAKDKAEYNIANGGRGGNPWNKGKKMPEELVKKNSDSHKGQIPWTKGKHLSEEIKRKISESKKCRQAWNKGKHLSEEQKRHYYGKHWKLVDGKRVYY